MRCLKSSLRQLLRKLFIAVTIRLLGCLSVYFSVADDLNRGGKPHGKFSFKHELNPQI